MITQSKFITAITGGIPAGYVYNRSKKEDGGETYIFYTPPGAGLTQEGLIIKNYDEEDGTNVNIRAHGLWEYRKELNYL